MLAAELFARAARILQIRRAFAIARDGLEERLARNEAQSTRDFHHELRARWRRRPSTSDFAASAGHSFGEYCSLTLAGSLTYDDAVALVNERALAMQEAAEIAPGAMAAVLGLDVAALRVAIESAGSEGCVQLANFNSPGQIVVSGDVAAVRRAARASPWRRALVRVVPLNVSGAWHSELMAPARERFAPFVERANDRLRFHLHRSTSERSTQKPVYAATSQRFTAT